MAGGTTLRDAASTQPLEPCDSKVKDNIRHLWYPVQEWGGVVWTYMGPEKDSPPPLPKIDVLARDDGVVKLADGDIRNYNYLNWMENFADMGHATDPARPGGARYSRRAETL